MSNKSLGNPFDADSKLTHTSSCACDLCKAEASNPQVSVIAIGRCC